MDGNIGNLLRGNMISGIFVFGFIILLTVGMEITWPVKK